MNELKIIRSDKSGKRIHSPFIYRLVSNILLVPYPFYSFSEIEKMDNSVLVLEDLKFIFRLVNHFQFETIMFNGEKDTQIETVCKLAKSDIKFETKEADLGLHDKCEYSRLLVMNKDNSDIESFPESPEIWVIMNEDLEKMELFTNLRVHSEVQITLKLNRIGIVIFNKNFEKQNYVINH